jgi:hypothetical protein
MSTLAKFGLWQKVQEPLLQTGSNRVSPDSTRIETRGNTGSNRANQENRPSTPSHSRKSDSHAHTHENAARARTDQQDYPVCPVCPVSPSKSADPDPVYEEVTGGLPGLAPASLHPAGEAALGSGIRGDDGLEWQGDVEEAQARTSEPEPHRAYLAPPARSLVARLAAAGATVRLWDGGDHSQVELPAGIPAELLREVEARGWTIIPGGRANPEAEHDSWLADVPIRELEP